MQTWSISLVSRLCSVLLCAFFSWLPVTLQHHHDYSSECLCIPHTVLRCFLLGQPGGCWCCGHFLSGLVLWWCNLFRACIQGSGVLLDTSLDVSLAIASGTWTVFQLSIKCHHDETHAISNHWQLDGLFNHLLRITPKQTSKPTLLVFWERESTGHHSMI